MHTFAFKRRQVCARNAVIRRLKEPAVQRSAICDRPRKPQDGPTGSPPRRSLPLRAWLLVIGLVLPACTGRAPVADTPRQREESPGLSAETRPTGDTLSWEGEEGARLLTGLSVEVGPGGVTLSWEIDEGRAHRVTGFSCVYRTPSHLSLGVSGAVPCGDELSGADQRERTVSGLPEFGEYLFEVVAQVGPGEVIEWPERALQVQVAVTPELAGPAGPALAVTGAGPMVTGCGPDDGPGDASAGRPWDQGQIVSAAHLTHYPGNAWAPGGDPDTAPVWPDPRALDDLFDEAGLDGQVFQQADPGDIAATLGDDRALDALHHASVGTKALLRPGAAGGWELRLHTSYPFGADYVFDARQAVAGWGDAAGPELYLRTDCPPPDFPDATHNVALAVSHDAGNGRTLEHAGYGWWVVAPVGMFPERIVATKAGLSFGEPAATAAAPGATYTGRASGHLFWDSQRYALAGDVTLTLEDAGSGDGTTRLSGRIDDLVLTALDHDTLSPASDPPARWRSLTLEAGAPSGDAWRGAVTAADRASEPGLAAMPSPDAFVGDWSASAYGPRADEIAGRLRLWTPLPPAPTP
ncbi:MAG: hypothetical protein OXN93_07295 [bacterium]|nr:hypothetical protein [bacterium]